MSLKDKIAEGFFNIMFMLLVASLLICAYVMAWALVAWPPRC